MSGEGEHAGLSEKGAAVMGQVVSLQSPEAGPGAFQGLAVTLRQLSYPCSRDSSGCPGKVPNAPYLVLCTAPGD